jgi:ribonuclease D
MWLQRDFGIRLVNVRDTQKLAGAVGQNSSISLSQLLLKHCGLQATKAFQVGIYCRRERKGGGA